MSVALQMQDRNTEVIADVLRKHWLFDIGQCDPICACFEHLGQYASVNAAVEAWIEHVMEELK